MYSPLAAAAPLSFYVFLNNTSPTIIEEGTVELSIGTVYAHSEVYILNPGETHATTETMLSQGSVPYGDHEFEVELVDMTGSAIGGHTGLCEISNYRHAGASAQARGMARPARACRAQAQLGAVLCDANLRCARRDSLFVRALTSRLPTFSNPFHALACRGKKEVHPRRWRAD